MSRPVVLRVRAADLTNARRVDDVPHAPTRAELEDLFRDAVASLDEPDDDDDNEKEKSNG